MIWYHKVSIRMPSILKAVSRAITSASDEECETALCFLHIHDNGTKVFAPGRAGYALLVDLLSRRSLAKLASANIAFVWRVADHADLVLVVSGVHVGDQPVQPFIACYIPACDLSSKAVD